MNYNISFSEMDRLAKQTNAKKPKFSLEEMRKQVFAVKSSSVSKVKKKQNF